VPYVRGAVSSKPLADAVSEAEALVRAGTREIVLAGIHAASYGKDVTGTENLPALIKAVHDTGVGRLRLSSIDPCAVDGAFLETAAGLVRLCPHFHLSLQSGCDATLIRMNRRYDTGQYKNAAQELRKISPAVALTTDIIAGFPGETEAEHAESLRFTEEMAFAGIHVFPYSPKAGTVAAGMPNQVPRAEKEARAARFRAMGEEMKRRYQMQFIGRYAEVLFETYQDGLAEGHTPEYITVRAPSAVDITNQIKSVRLDAVQNHYINGTIRRTHEPFGNAENKRHGARRQGAGAQYRGDGGGGA
jgi:threonylcarbamoyladenosine tRNA methylthiotransferase MtaB